METVGNPVICPIVVGTVLKAVGTLLVRAGTVQSETGQKNMPTRTWTLGGLRLNMEQVFVSNIERTLTLTWETQEH